MTEDIETMQTEPAETREVVSVKFRNRGKMYFFDPAGLTLPQGAKVIVETAKGLEIGNIVQANHTVPAAQIVKPLSPVVRIATPEDGQIEERCRRREREAYVIAKQKIKAHGLDMKLVDVECSFEGNKILFFFSSDGRVDFRELVKDLAGVFRTRIELRQIGVRDEARMLGGLGICGRPFCCGCFMEEFAPVSTKMAKVQSMSLNPAKISGCCGRLMCCLRYEQPAYEELVKNVPKNGAFVETPDGYGNVTQVNVLRQTVKVRLDGPGEDSFRVYDAEDVAAIPGGRPRDGSPPPHVLVLKPKKPKEPEEQPEDMWQMPERLIMTEEERLAETHAGENTRRRNDRSRRRDGAPREQEQGGNRQQRNRSRRQGESADGEHRQQKPKNRPPKQSKPAEGGEAKPEQKQQQKKRYNNHRRRPKNGGAKPQNGGTE